MRLPQLDPHFQEPVTRQQQTQLGREGGGEEDGTLQTDRQTDRLKSYLVQFVLHAVGVVLQDGGDAVLERESRGLTQLQEDVDGGLHTGRGATLEPAGLEGQLEHRGDWGTVGEGGIQPLESVT